MNGLLQVFRDQGGLKKGGRNVKKSAPLLASIIVISFLTACSSMWEPSETEAVNLVENYYLFYRAGKEVDPEIIERGKFIRECKCFPIKFRIMSNQQENFEKTFYFFKNSAGIVEVSEYQSGVLT